jgi:hypothetical protein
MENLNDRVEAVYNRITERAYEKWLGRRPGASIPQLWAAAEQELIFKPKTQVREWGHGVRVQIVCPDVDATKVRLFMSSAELLVLAPLDNAGLDKWIFQYLRFSQPVDNVDASAQYEGGNLHISATLLNAPDEEKVRFGVA